MPAANYNAAVLANGAAGNAPITAEGDDFDAFCAAPPSWQTARRAKT